MPQGISVNAVARGPIDTLFFYPQEGDKAVATYKSSALSGRLTKIEDIALLIVFLCAGGA